MAGLLEETRRRWAGTSCAAYPCGLEVWRYCCERAGVAVAPLPAHDERKDMLALLRQEGGLVAYAGNLIEPLGWTRRDAPRGGDVGVIDAPGLGHTCAIFLGRRWAAKGNGFMVMIPASPVAVWGFE